MINCYKGNLPFELEKGENLMCIIFQSFSDTTIHYPFICKNKQVFEDLENHFYEKYPQFKDTQNYFMVDTFPIDTKKTLEENKIKNGSIIIININDLNDTIGNKNN